MAKSNDTGKNELMDRLLAITVANTTKTRGLSGKTTYLDRFVGILLDENGQPRTKGMTRQEINARMSYDICVESKQAEGLEFNVEDAEDLVLFTEVNEKCKHQIAAAVSDSNNSTALSFNAAYKDVWSVVKEGSLVRLISKADVVATEETAAEEVAAE